MISGILIIILVTLSAGTLCWRGISIAAHIDRTLWYGQRWRFAGFSASVALVVGGGVGVAAGWVCGQYFLLVGTAGWFIFDRRL